jgi:hypothetical protein
MKRSEGEAGMIGYGSARLDRDARTVGHGGQDGVERLDPDDVAWSVPCRCEQLAELEAVLRVESSGEVRVP